VVRQTATKKKSLKRKRDEAQETDVKNQSKAKGQRLNPFAFGAVKSKGDPKPPRTESTTDSLNAPTNDAASSKPVISKRQQARNRAEKRAQRQLESSLSVEDSPSTTLGPISQATPTLSLPALTPLQQKMKAKLSGSQFRHINEKLYTTHSSEALSLFTSQPSLFHDVPLLLP
jgi:ribosomal RNA-processing protein 8